MERKRLVADRFRRIWHIVEDIAETPGESRRELADKFHLSERQVQADLNIIRTDMRLPLVRRQGYRFIAEGAPGGGEGCFDLREGQQQQVFAALADGLLRGTYVKLHYPPGDLSSPIPEPIIRPELLLPYLNSWYLIGECRQRNRTMMFNLDAVTAVTLAAEA